MSEIVGLVARAIDEAIAKWQPGSSQRIHEMAAHAAIDAVDAFRAEEKRNNCKHFGRLGSGSGSSSGFISYSWHCPECGASESYSNNPLDRALSPSHRTNADVGGANPSGIREGKS